MCCQETLAAMNACHEVNNQVTLLKIVERLPPYLQSRWKKQVAAIHKTKNPDINDVVKFVVDAAAIQYQARPPSWAWNSPQLSNPRKHPGDDDNCCLLYGLLLVVTNDVVKMVVTVDNMHACGCVQQEIGYIHATEISDGTHSYCKNWCSLETAAWHGWLEIPTTYEIDTCSVQLHPLCNW